MNSTPKVISILLWISVLFFGYSVLSGFGLFYSSDRSSGVWEPIILFAASIYCLRVWKKRDEHRRAGSIVALVVVILLGVNSLGFLAEISYMIEYPILFINVAIYLFLFISWLYTYKELKP